MIGEHTYNDHAISTRMRVRWHTNINPVRPICGNWCGENSVCWRGKCIAKPPPKEACCLFQICIWFTLHLFGHFGIAVRALACMRDVSVLCFM